MNPNAICPISNSKVDENVARLNAVLTVLFFSCLRTNQQHYIRFIPAD